MDRRRRGFLSPFSRRQQHEASNSVTPADTTTSMNVLHCSSNRSTSLSPIQRRLHQQKTQPLPTTQPLHLPVQQQPVQHKCITKQTRPARSFSAPHSSPIAQRMDKALSKSTTSSPIVLISKQSHIHPHPATPNLVAGSSDQSCQIAPCNPLTKLWNPPKRKVQSQDPTLLPLLHMPHPAYAQQEFLLLADGRPALEHPSLLQYPPDRFQCLNDLQSEPFALLTAKRLTESSYSTYHSTYTNLWYLLTHILSVREDEGFTPYVCLNWAIRWCFQAKQHDQCASVHSHLKHFIDTGIIPESCVQMTCLRLLSNNVKMSNSGEHNLAYRLLMPPQDVISMYNVIVQPHDNNIPPDPVDIYIMLGLLTGQHLAESYNFSWKLYFDGALMTWPPFKHRKEETKLPVSTAFVKLYNFVKHHFPEWFMDTPIAHALWPTSSDLATAVTARLQTCKDNDQIFRGYSETLSHRILRRTFASILHHFQCSHKTISTLLNHNSKKAVASYVSLLHINHMEIIKKNVHLFKQMLPPAEYTNHLNKPTLFEPAGPKSNKNKPVDMNQPRITAWTSQS